MTLTPHVRKNPSFSLLFIAVTFTLFCLPAAMRAQTLPEMKAQVKALVDQQKFTEALPLLEKLAQAEPNSADTHFYLGFALIGQAKNTVDRAERKALMIRARAAFAKSVTLGNDTQMAKAMAESIPADGSEPEGYSANPEANAQMEKAEAAFTTGKMDDALAAYQAAYKLDPTLYYAALFAGDVYKVKTQYADAEIWYQKAITINPFIETAYRYSATPLMLQKKFDLARDRYVEAYIVEPYSRLALSGLLQWGQVTQTELAHPRIDVPEIKQDAAGKSTSSVNINPLADDGSMAWMSYVVTRTGWRDGFAAKNPGKTYRHSLAEEAAALRSVVKAAKDLKAKNPNTQIETLAKLDKDGVLEAFILLAIPDEGIAEDHAVYLRQHRDKLRLYVTKYIIGGGK